MREVKILHKFKETGQKKVFLVEDPEYGKVVYKQGKSPSKGSLDRAKREVLVQKEINTNYYPNIIKFEELSDKEYLIIEEYIDSSPLSGCFNLFKNPLKLITLFDEITKALVPIWEEGITHRDLKPDNILIRPNNSPVIIDLGIVLVKDMTRLTHPLAKISPCTVKYAAPELLKYQRNRYDINHRADQFILGIDMVQIMLEGKHPFSPDLVGGTSIPENILKDNWYREILQSSKYSPFNSLVTSLLGREAYQRFRTPELLIEQIENTKEKIQ